MIIYALIERHKNPDTDIRIITEVTERSNNNKAFKKIPAMCNILQLNVRTLHQLLEKHNGISVEFK